MDSQRIPAQFRENIHINPETECWEWLAGKVPAGYAMLWHDHKQQMGHRVMYELLRGPIPAGFHIDHLCRNRGCINPDHLEPVTIKENILRGEGPGAINARKTHCKHGHEFTAENTHISSTTGERCCRACGRRKYYLAKARRHGKREYTSATSALRRNDGGL